MKKIMEQESARARWEWLVLFRSVIIVSQGYGCDLIVKYLIHKKYGN